MGNTKKAKPIPEEVAKELNEVEEVTTETNETVEEPKEEVVEEKVEEVAKEEPKKKPFKVKIVDCHCLNVRKGPSTDYEVLSRLNVNTILMVEESDDPEWLKTGSGYIMKQFTKRL